MELTSTSNSIKITGNIKSVSDFSQIKSLIDGVVMQHQNITIDIVDSLSITSSVIGYFNKLVLKDKININMGIGNEQLLNLLEDLSLVATFKARRL
ncbi:MAG: hypothetical protein U9N33_12545 [Campylobacterota bacterium]|nr:hypothetical protein [Campylobacterota bacterium]